MYSNYYLHYLEIMIATVQTVLWIMFAMFGQWGSLALVLATFGVVSSLPQGDNPYQLSNHQFSGNLAAMSFVSRSWTQEVNIVHSLLRIDRRTFLMKWAYTSQCIFLVGYGSYLHGIQIPWRCISRS
jgi:hypothetical protein